VLTPLDISKKVAAIRQIKTKGGQVATIRAQMDTKRLYVEVLTEIARGSIDPRTLALTALEAEVPE
jgi:hypothetical protein